MDDDTNTDLTALTADVVSAYVSNNSIGAEDLAKLIGSTYAALKGVGQPTPSEPELAMPDKAAVRKSQHPTPTRSAAWRQDKPSSTVSRTPARKW